MFINRNKILALIIAASFATGCDVVMDPELPENTIVTENAIQTEQDLVDLLNSGYDVLANNYNGRVQTFSELMADNLSGEFTDNNGFLTEIYNRNTNFFNSDIKSFYEEQYRTIYRVNLLLGSFNQVKSLSEAKRQQMEAEAKFLRAFSYFDLVRLMAQPYEKGKDNQQDGIPIRLEPKADPVIRTSVNDVYNKVIIPDLQFAEANLPAENGVYADKYAAKALLAHVYFQMNDFENAAKYAGEVIESGKYSLADDIMSRFGTEVSSEGIFTIISTSNSDVRSSYFKDRYREFSATRPAHLRVNKQFANLVKSRPEDKRNQWFSVKNEGEQNEYVAITLYDNDFQNVALLHLAQMYLIRAESLAELGTNKQLAISDLNKVKARAGVATLSLEASVSTIIDEARLERRIELVTEGNRVMDLKRIGAKGEDVGIRNATWNCPGLILQFPATEQTSGFNMNPQGGC